MEVLRSAITGITPQRYGISNGLGASLYRCVAWLEAVPSGSERELHRGGGSIFDQDYQLFCGGRCHQFSQDARRSPGGDRRSECHQEAGMLCTAYEARNAESANLDSTLAKRLMDKDIRLRVFARKQMS